MSRRISREEFANMERMLIEYRKGYEGIYSICYRLTVKIDELSKQIAELQQENTDRLTGLGDK